MLVVVPLVWVVEMAVVQIINMAFVLDAQMAAVFAVYVRMVVMYLVAHKVTPDSEWGAAAPMALTIQMVTAALKEIAHVIIIKAVEGVFAFLAKLNEVQMAQQAQLM